MPRLAQQDLYGGQGVGRYRLTIGGQRNVPEQEWLRQPHPSQEAERPRCARDDAAGQQCQIENPLVERAFAEQKDRMGLFIRTIRIARATAKIGIANLVYNIKLKIAVARRTAHIHKRCRPPFLAGGIIRSTIALELSQITRITRQLRSLPGGVRVFIMRLTPNHIRFKKYPDQLLREEIYCRILDHNTLRINCYVA
jgi:hypothetical protein